MVEAEDAGFDEIEAVVEGVEAGVPREAEPGIDADDSHERQSMEGRGASAPGVA